MARLSGRWGASIVLQPRMVGRGEGEYFSSLLVELREAKGLTQMDIALQLGKPQSYVSKYERGERRLDIVELIAVTKVLGVDPAQLCTELACEPLFENFDKIFHPGGCE